MRSRLLRPLAAAALLLTGPALIQSASAQSAPVLRLPGAGPVAGVVETRLRDGFDQRIRFEGGDGRNHAEVALRNETGDLLLAFPPRLAKPSQFGIEGEIAVRFPGQLLRVVAPRRNSYGPVGLALGTDCLYAWQWFERASAAQRVASRGGLFDGSVAPTAGRRALSLRIRLCRTAQASLDDLVAAVERMTINLPGVSGVKGPRRQRGRPPGLHPAKRPLTPHRNRRPCLRPSRKLRRRSGRRHRHRPTAAGAATSPPPRRRVPPRQPTHRPRPRRGAHSATSPMCPNRPRARAAG